jgi:hypothetical protein
MPLPAGTSEQFGNGYHEPEKSFWTRDTVSKETWNLAR